MELAVFAAGSTPAGSAASSDASNSRPANAGSRMRVSTQATRARRPPAIMAAASRGVGICHNGNIGVSPVFARCVSR